MVTRTALRISASFSGALVLRMRGTGLRDYSQSSIEVSKSSLPDLSLHSHQSSRIEVKVWAYVQITIGSRHSSTNQAIRMVSFHTMTCPMVLS